MRVTRRESKREEKRTRSGSIRRMSERDGESEGDRDSGGVVEVRGDEEKTQERGYIGAREAAGMEARERRRGTKPSRIPRFQHWQPNERTYVYIYVGKC